MSQKDPIKTAARTLDVFEIFAAAKGPLTLTELAGRLGSPLSSCHALIRTLQLRGYIYVLGERKRVYPTKRLLMIAQQIAQNDPMLEQIAPVLLALQQETGETIILGKRQGNVITYLDVIDSHQTIRYAASPGDVKPLHSSAIGKAMLGLLSDEELARQLKRLPLTAVTDHTIIDIPGLLQDIGQSRARGYFQTRGENVSDVMAFSISSTVGDEDYGVAVAGPMGRVEAHAALHISALRRVRDALGRLDAELRGDP
jgi:IclR family acetate operon transcriptional repressor